MFEGLIRTDIAITMPCACACTVFLNNLQKVNYMAKLKTLFEDEAMFAASKYIWKWKQFTKVSFSTLPNKITSNLDYHLEILPLFKLLIMLQCSIWYEQVI